MNIKEVSLFSFRNILNDYFVGSPDLGMQLHLSVINVAGWLLLVAVILTSFSWAPKWKQAIIVCGGGGWAARGGWTRIMTTFSHNCRRPPPTSQQRMQLITLPRSLHCSGVSQLKWFQCSLLRVTGPPAVHQQTSTAPPAVSILKVFHPQGFPSSRFSKCKMWGYKTRQRESIWFTLYKH